MSTARVPSAKEAPKKSGKESKEPKEGAQSTLSSQPQTVCAINLNSAPFCAIRWHKSPRLRAEYAHKATHCLRASNTRKVPLQHCTAHELCAQRAAPNSRPHFWPGQLSASFAYAPLDHYPAGPEQKAKGRPPVWPSSPPKLHAQRAQESANRTFQLGPLLSTGLQAPLADP